VSDPREHDPVEETLAEQEAEAGAGAPAEAGATGASDAGATPADAAAEEAPAGEAPAGEAPAGDAPGGEEAVEHDIEDLVSQARAERDEYLDLAQRTKADFDNYRRRMTAETASAAARGRLEVVPGLIEALDNIERVLDSEGVGAAEALDGRFPDGAAVSLQGVIVAYRDLHSTLRRINVEAYDPKGEAFDPHLHEALQAVPADGVDSGVVVEVMQRGYRSEDHVIRPARVVVSQ
jgi:molecular chaperone GrpE